MFRIALLDPCRNPRNIHLQVSFYFWTIPSNFKGTDCPRVWDCEIFHVRSCLLTLHCIENTSGQVKVSALEPLSKLIAEHVRPISSTIFRIFQNVISARTAAYRAFQQLVAVKPDFETEESNASHKAFIDALTRAYNVLGGEE